MLGHGAFFCINEKTVLRVNDLLAVLHFINCPTQLFQFIFQFPAFFNLSAQFLNLGSGNILLRAIFIPNGTTNTSGRAVVCTSSFVIWVYYRRKTI